MSDKDEYDEQVSRRFDVIYNVIDKPRQEAEQEADKWKLQGDMYGWNFHKGRANGMTEVDISVREALRPAVAAALREANTRRKESDDALRQCHAEIADLKAKLAEADEIIEMACAHNDGWTKHLMPDKSLYERLTGGFDELLGERQKLCRENFELRAKLAPFTNDGQTHFEGCWKDRGHHACVVDRLAEAEKRGMELAIKIGHGFEKGYDIYWWMSTPKKEIYKVACLDLLEYIRAELEKKP